MGTKEDLSVAYSPGDKIQVNMTSADLLKVALYDSCIPVPP